MTDQFGSPLPLSAVARSPEPTLVWALSPHTIRVHIASSDGERTLCDLPVESKREKIEPRYLFCGRCREVVRQMPWRKPR